MLQFYFAGPFRQGYVNHPQDDALEMVIQPPPGLVDIEPIGFDPSPASSDVDSTSLEMEIQPPLREYLKRKFGFF